MPPSMIPPPEIIKYQPSWLNGIGCFWNVPFLFQLDFGPGVSVAVGAFIHLPLTESRNFRKAFSLVVLMHSISDFLREARNVLTTASGRNRLITSALYMGALMLYPATLARLVCFAVEWARQTYPATKRAATFTPLA
ncbi:hypothetical protein EMPG_12032 [Blastomyces silverae]|uniref:Uncharacterized protein n=1 Tax=Blastomyces silverae TaxID=2060906 RepID=A0A0H1BVB4_9EURO|nr:hypothetical protein EMPG_12032 [Blastomyces silverae]